MKFGLTGTLALPGGTLALLAGDNVELDEVIGDAGAGTEFEPVADFFPEGVEGVCGTQAVAAALRIFAACCVTAIGACYRGFELHATATLTLGVYAVNDPNNDRAERRVGIADDLPRRIAFINHQHALADAGLNPAVTAHAAAAAHLPE